MSTSSRVSLRSAVNAKCKACIYDPHKDVPGGWREQVADCASAYCELHPVRPVPRDCMTDGIIDREKVSAVRAELAKRRAEIAARNRQKR